MTELNLDRWTTEGIASVPISMAPPLKWVNSYVLRGEEGITVVDPGPRTADTEEEWRKAWHVLGIAPKDISSIIVTHHHPDHYGLAGYMQSETGAKVLMSRRAFQEANLMWGPRSIMNEALPDLFRLHGMPTVWTDQLPPHMNSFFPQVSPAPQVTYISDGDQILFGGRSWQAIESGGHAPGHLSFYDPGRRWMLCGDAVLPQISPNISYLPDSDPQPLKSFIEALGKLGKYEVELAFPGHRNAFTYFGERVRLLLQHHEERLLRMESLLREQPRTGFDVCAALFGTDLGIHQMRFAMAETLAHLLELVRQGRVKQHMDGQVVIFQ